MPKRLQPFTIYLLPHTRRPRRGQALIIMILVMGVALTIGLAISGRTIMTLRQISYSEQSAKALSFAEAGLEHALLCVKEGTCGAGDSGTLNVDGQGGNDCDYGITALPASQVFDKLSPISRDSTVQVDLSGYGANRYVYLNWVDRDNISELADPAAMEISIIYRDSGGNYHKRVFAWDPDDSRRLGPNGNYLNYAATGASASLNPGWIGGVNYRYRLTLPRLIDYEGYQSGWQYALVRLRALYIETPNSFAVQGNVNLPSQGVEIESTGYSGQVRRKVWAARATPALPSLFDFVLFSGSSSVPLTK